MLVIALQNLVLSDLVYADNFVFK